MRILIVKEINSTQTYLIENKTKYDGILTHNQLRGIGRAGNSWLSSEGSLLFSFYYKRKENIYKEILFALKKTLEFFKIQNITVKWPNDILINNKKICGIIISEINYSNCNNTLSGDEYILNDYNFKKEVVIGFGLNLHNNNFLYTTVENLTKIKIEKINFLQEFFNQLKDLKVEDFNFFDSKKAYFKNKEYEIIENDIILLKNEENEILISSDKFSYDIKNNNFYEKN